ncbi:MAG: DNA recombination protein RmuC [Betaproteobacteria bacterium]|nr:DNA recombination protein RmuC [Betaproteobacteria bacterium]
MPELLIALCVLLLLLALWLAWRMAAVSRKLEELPTGMAQGLEEKHRAMLTDLHGGLTQQGDRLGTNFSESSERLRGTLAEELKQTRDTLYALKLGLSENLGQSREAMIKQLAATTEQLNAKIDQRLEQISGKVSERLDEGFKKTNETFVNVMQRLATIDEAQKKIDSLTGSVISLQELLGDKKSRGAFGEVQLEALVRNVMPPGAFEMQYTLSNGTRADCVLKLPEPTGLVTVDSKFPLENYHRMFEAGVNEADRSLAQKAFRSDIKRHVDAIASKYIIANETSDGAVMFVPAEAVFAEIHAYHAEVVEYANARRVWIVSPTTLMAVLNTARAVLKDVETRKQIHVIKESLARLALEFGRFDERMKKLADHIRQANEDVEKIQVTGGKITQQFQRIEAAEIDEKPAADNVMRLAEERKS